LQLFMDVVVRL